MNENQFEFYCVWYQPIGKKDIRSRKPKVYSDTYFPLSNRGWTIKEMAKDILKMQDTCVRIVVVKSEYMYGSSLKDKIWEWRREED